MTDKPKRKNDQPIPRRYWWIFGILAIVLLIGLRFPVRILYWWALNPIGYALLTMACFIAMIRFVQNFHSKRILVLLIVGCFLLSSLHCIGSMWFYQLITHEHETWVRDRGSQCVSKHSELFTTTECGNWFYSVDFVSLRYIPIAVETYGYWSP